MGTAYSHLIESKKAARKQEPSYPFPRKAWEREKDGNYKGWVEKGGEIYSDEGNYKGWVEKGGEIYGEDGSYKGWVEKDGSIYGADGSYKGEVDDN